MLCDPTPPLAKASAHFTTRRVERLIRARTDDRRTSDRALRCGHGARDDGPGMARCRFQKGTTDHPAIRLKACDDTEERTPTAAVDCSAGAACANTVIYAGPGCVLEEGHPLTQREEQGLVRRAARRANLANVGVHILRHTFCSHLAMHGAPTRAIQELAGHGEIVTTQRYMHLSPAAIDSAIRLLDQRGNIVATAATSAENINS